MSDFESDGSFASVATAKPTDHNPNYATFYLHPVLNKPKSKEAGREIYDDKLYILILCPGQSKTEMRRPAKDEDKRVYPAAWQAFSEGKATPISGTPVEQLPGVTPARAKAFHALHIRTVEQLASVPDQNCYQLGPDGNTMRNAAKAFVEKNSTEIQALRAQNQALAKKLNDRESQLLDLSERLARLEAAQQPASHPKPSEDAGAIPNEFPSG